MLARASLAALFGFLLLREFSGAAQARSCYLRGKLWLVSNTNLNATRPVPAAAPDATFLARHISFAMTAPRCTTAGINNVNNSVEGFLASSHPDRVPPVEDLAFSGQYNSVVGTVVDGTTPVVNSTAASNGTYGTYMTLEGTIQLANGQYIYIAHDDGVSCGLMASGYRDFTDRGCSVIKAYTFTGLTGAHKIELIYVNDCRPGLPKFLSPDVNIAKASTSENPRSLKSARFSPSGGRDRGEFRKRRALGRSPARFNSLLGRGFSWAAHLLPSLYGDEQRNVTENPAPRGRP